MDAIVFFFTILGGLIAFFSYYKSHIEEPQKNKEYCVAKIKSAQKMNNDFLKELHTHVKENNIWEEHFMDGYSYEEVINVLKIYRDKGFSDDNIKKLENVDGNSRALQDIANKSAEHILIISNMKNFFHKNILNEKWKYE